MPTPGLTEFVLIAVQVLVYVAVVVVIGRALIGALRGRRDPALDALRTRFARGEIDEAEYERLRSALQRG